MFARYKVTNPATMIRIGMASLVLSLALPRLVSAAGAGEDVTDFVRGLCLTLSIGCNLRGIWLRGRGRRNPDAGRESTC